MRWPSTSTEELSAAQETALLSPSYQRQTVPSPTTVQTVRPVGRVRSALVQPPSTQTVAVALSPSRVVTTVRE